MPAVDGGRQHQAAPRHAAGAGDPLAEEHERLHRLPRVPHTVCFGETRKVSWQSTISVGGALYSVPHALVDQRVWARIDGEELVVVDADRTGGPCEVARHQLTTPGRPAINYPPPPPPPHPFPTLPPPPPPPLFYEDLAPFQEYAHGGRVVLVDVKTGRVSVSAKLAWPPTLNGRLPVFLASQTAYLSPRYRVFYRPYTGAAVRANRASSRMSSPGVRRRRLHSTRLRARRSPRCWHPSMHAWCASATPCVAATTRLRTSRSRERRWRSGSRSWRASQAAFGRLSTRVRAAFHRRCSSPIRSRRVAART